VKLTWKWRLKFSSTLLVSQGKHTGIKTLKFHEMLAKVESIPFSSGVPLIQHKIHTFQQKCWCNQVISNSQCKYILKFPIQELLRTTYCCTNCIWNNFSKNQCDVTLWAGIRKASSNWQCIEAIFICLHETVKLLTWCNKSKKNICIENVLIKNRFQLLTSTNIWQWV